MFSRTINAFNIVLLNIMLKFSFKICDGFTSHISSPFSCNMSCLLIIYKNLKYIFPIFLTL